MPKALELTDDALAAPVTIPRAAQGREASNSGKTTQTREEKTEQMPLQVRLPRREVKAIKIAAAEEEKSISEFMLACFHAYMKSRNP